VVGPNGCGQSNLVEALRWVMGENSYKNMRASGMDDVIFSGSGTRPARNTAEVALFLKNADRTAPAAFNDADEIQVTRRIAREAGSVYRINGKEARAKDVQLLFADQSTGARSPSMVGQGRIGELIQAKPQARRALLEEAAGISGLHSRRHEAELRLRAAESNLSRLDDVVAELESQIESLKRQARQATRFKALSKDIRAAEATVLHLRWTAAKAQEAEAKSQLAQATSLVAEHAQTQMSAAKDQAVAAHRLPGLRDEEAKAAAALQRLTIARAQLEEDARRLAARRAELERRAQQLAADTGRERALLNDNAGALDRLAQEEASLNRAEADAAEKAPVIALALQQAELQARACESALQAVTAERAAAAATRNQMARLIGEMRQRLAKLDIEADTIRQQLEALAAQASRLPDVATRQAQAQEAAKAVGDAEQRAAEAETALEAARAAEAATRPALAEARAALNRVETESRTLAKILNAANPGLFAPVVECMKVARGYETALGAALGEDLELSTDRNAPAFWAEVEPADADPALPQGAARLADFVDAPAALARRLAQTGVVEAGDGARLQPLLRPGQRLVARDGAMWRWDGVTVRADAPTPAAQRLAQKNRLTELDGEVAAARNALAKAEATARDAETAMRAAADLDRAAREAAKAAQAAYARAGEAVTAAERAGGELAQRRAVLDEQAARAGSDRSEIAATLSAHETALAQAPDPAALDARFGEANGENAAARGQLAEARAASQDLARERDARARRLAAIETERESWVKRAADAEEQIAALAAREAEAAAELADLADQPEELERKQRELGVAIRTAEQDRKTAADRLADAETASREADRKAADALNALAQAREARGRAEERQLAAEERRAETETRIRDALHCAAHEAFRLTELDAARPLPDLEPVERNLERLRMERERLG
ncbi:MAG TPA: chromosome segregation SMC family protein, partial [Rhizobiaceae bacterium]|nr:chromosome segregation SMC family protein [Rhizobiaceae bacterium]